MAMYTKSCSCFLKKDKVVFKSYEIKPVINIMEDIHHIKSVIEVSVFTEKQVLCFWGGVALLLGMFMVYAWWRVYQYYLSKQARQKKQNGDQNYQNRTRHRLKQVRRKIDQGDFKAYYLEMTEIIKNYLSCHYKAKLTKLTTRETMRKCKASPAMKDLIGLFLKRVDEAKFANENLKVPSAEAVFEIAKRITNGSK